MFRRERPQKGATGSFTRSARKWLGGATAQPSMRSDRNGYGCFFDRLELQGVQLDINQSAAANAARKYVELLPRGASE